MKIYSKKINNLHAILITVCIDDDTTEIDLKRINTINVVLNSDSYNFELFINNCIEI